MSGRMLCHQADAVHKLFVPTGQDKDAGAQRMRSASNAGLVWNRYLDLWLWRDGALPKIEDGTERRNALLMFAADYNARGKLASPLAGKLLEAIHARQIYILARLRGGGCGEAFQRILASRFATGLGGPHPTEIGFTFDRSVGVPYLPGSSVKGLARAAARLRADPSMETLFGPDRIDRDGDVNIGDLIFLDAYPVSLPQLEVDVINCHHPAYYAGHSPYPSETEDPVPVYFLTVAAGTTWIFRLLSRSGKHVAQGADLLRFGLKELGAGAKTAVGYGSFAV